MTPLAAPFGQALPRVDGPDKVTGRALYGGEHQPPRAAHAWLGPSAIARGHIRAIDSAGIASRPGVLLVLTHENASGLVHEAKSVAGGGHLTFSRPPLASGEIFFAGQIVAVVVAETAEIARDAAESLRVEYAPQ